MQLNGWLTLDTVTSLICVSLVHRRMVQSNIFCMRGIVFRFKLALAIGFTSLNTFIICTIVTVLNASGWFACFRSCSTISIARLFCFFVFLLLL